MECHIKGAVKLWGGLKYKQVYHKSMLINVKKSVLSSIHKNYTKKCNRLHNEKNVLTFTVFHSKLLICLCLSCLSFIKKIFKCVCDMLYEVKFGTRVIEDIYDFLLIVIFSMQLCMNIIFLSYTCSNRSNHNKRA